MTPATPGPRDRPPVHSETRAATTARTTGMIDARRRDSQTKRARVADTLDRMLADGHADHVRPGRGRRPGSRPGWSTPPASASASSTPAPFRPPDPTRPNSGGRRLDRPAATAGHGRRRGPAHRPRAGPRRDHPAARERDHHRQQLRLALGARLDDLAKADLAARVDELTRHNNELAATLTRRNADNQALRERVTDLEDDLAAARTSLRRMIRAQNLPPTPDVSPEPR